MVLKVGWDGWIAMDIFVCLFRFIHTVSMHSWKKVICLRESFFGEYFSEFSEVFFRFFPNFEYFSGFCVFFSIVFFQILSSIPVFEPKLRKDFFS